MATINPMQGMPLAYTNSKDENRLRCAESIATQRQYFYVHVFGSLNHIY